MSKCLWWVVVFSLVVPAAAALDPPSDLAATTVSASRVDLSWTAVGGAARYEVERSVTFNVWVPTGNALTSVFSDTSVAAGAAYLYRVRAKDDAIVSTWSAPALATTFSFTDDPVVPGLTLAKAVHVTEIRGVAGAVRSLGGLSPATYEETVGAGGVPKASHLLEVRSALDPARSALGLPALSYANTLAAGVTPIRAVDLDELRDGASGRPSQFWRIVEGLSGVQALAGSGATIVAGTVAQGVYRSIDHGQTWSQSNSGLPVMNVASAAVTTGGTIFAGTIGGGVFRSTTSGASWALSGSSPPQNVTTLLAAPAGVFAASSVAVCSGVSFSDDGGATWTPRSNGLTNACVTSMAVATDGDLFAGTAGGGVFRSRDDGQSWTAVNSGISSTNMHAVAVDASGRVHAASHSGGVFVSSSDGDAWASSTLLADVYSLFLDPTDELFAGGEGSGATVFRSSDGVAWGSAHDRLPRAARIDAFGATSRYRFVVADGNVYRAPGEFRLHGLDFGPYLTESVGTTLSDETLKERMQVLRPNTKWIRNFGMTSGLQNIGRIAHGHGLKAALCANITGNTAANATEIANLIAAANDGEADLLIVGSEVMRRRDECLANCAVSPECTALCQLTESQLIAYIDQVRQGTSGTGLLVGTAELFDKLLQYPAVLQAGTVVLPNYYPWYHNVAVEHAVETLDGWHQEIVAAAGPRPVIVSETGWPSAGTPRFDAVPSEANAAFYLMNFVSWARAKRVGYFYFEAFDENWKSGEPNGAGTHWGLRTTAAALKPGMDAVLAGDTMGDNWSGTTLIGGPGTPSVAFTSVPPYGNTADLLRGTVTHVRPIDHRVAVYIYINGWWNKPTHANPLTKIYADGTWVCDVVTGGQDELATQIAAFIVPDDYVPELLSGAQQLPDDLDGRPQVFVTRP